MRVIILTLICFLLIGCVEIEDDSKDNWRYCDTYKQIEKQECNNISSYNISCNKLDYVIKNNIKLNLRSCKIKYNYSNISYCHKSMIHTDFLIIMI